ncbi:MAG TPA: hypothetical protein VFN78_09115 [Ktedonobacterales bacterium]|nr:hypothetical protein [Ktedonobacterales bacterium]
MIWLTLRRHRTELIIVGIAFAAIAGYILVTGIEMYAAYDHMTRGVSVALCERQARTDDLCLGMVRAFTEKYSNPVYAFTALYVFPAGVGAVLGAPLVASDLERGAFRLAWTQSVTRLRWLLTSLGAQIVVTLLPVAMLVALAYWWRGPFAASMDGAIDSSTYLIKGSVPLAYALFSLALGVAAGALLRRVVPALFATLGGYIAVALAMANWWRPNFVPPVTQTWDPSVTTGPSRLTSNAWIYFIGYVDKTGQRLDINTAMQTCSPSGIEGFTGDSPGSSFAQCLHAHGWLSMGIWQPASRYWLFQGIESGILVAVALLLLGFTVWWVKRQLS